MITGKDLEDMGYFDQFDLNKPENSTVLADYTDWVEKKIVTTGDDRLIENTLGLVGEAGEVANKVKKLMRDGVNNMPENWRDDIASEIGDVLWYCAALATDLNLSLGTIAGLNQAKLHKRMSENKIGGSGDNR